MAARVVLTCFHELGKVGEFAFGWWGHAIVFVGVVGGAGLRGWGCGVGAWGRGIVIFLEIVHRRTSIEDRTLARYILSSTACWW